MIAFGSVGSAGRWTVAGIACGLSAVAALFFLVGDWDLGTKPEWRRLVDEALLLNESFRTDPERSRKDICLDADAERITSINERLRLPMWDVEEAGMLAEIVRKRYPKEIRDQNQTRAERSQGFVCREALWTISARLSFKAPITPRARAMLIDLLVEQVDAPFPELRVAAATDLICLSEIENNAIRAAVERLLDDPDPSVADDVAFMLARYDDDKTQGRIRPAATR